MSKQNWIRQNKGLWIREDGQWIVERHGRGCWVLKRKVEIPANQKDRNECWEICGGRKPETEEEWHYLDEYDDFLPFKTPEAAMAFCKEEDEVTT